MIKYKLGQKNEIRIIGRTLRRDDLALFWTGSGMEFCFDGTQVWIDIESDYTSHEDWIRVEVNGCTVERMMIPKGHNKICLLRGLENGTCRKIRIYKEVQPMIQDESRKLIVHSIELDGRLYKMAQPDFRMEVIGDSLTAGEGLNGPVGMVNSASNVFGTEGHYAIEAAKELNAEISIMAQSGWGVYCSWDNNTQHTMPYVYEKVCGPLHGAMNESLGTQRLWDFTEWQPDIIVVNLGSNDGFAFDYPQWVNPETQEVIHQYKNADGSYAKECTDKISEAVHRFLINLRHNNPNAYLLWAYGMIDHSMRPYIEEGILQYKKCEKDEKASFLALPYLQKGWLGSNNHPGIISHRAAKECLVDKIREIRGINA